MGTPEQRARLEDLLAVLTGALETLNLVKTRRLLALLEVLAQQTEADAPGRASFYARACRGMFALVEGDLVGASRMTDEAERIGVAAGLHETRAVCRSLRHERTRQLGDREGLAAAAAECEASGSLGDRAEAAVLWLESGDVARAGRIVDDLAVHVAALTSGLPDDRSRLLVLSRICEAAVGSGRRIVASSCARAMEGSLHRGIVGTNATVFAGVVDDYVALVRGDRELAVIAREQYQGLGAWWWSRRRPLETRRSTTYTRVMHLHPSHEPGVAAQWCVGSGASVQLVNAMPGLDYLRALLQRPGRDVTAEELVGAVSTGAYDRHDPRLRVVVRQAIAAALSRLEMHSPEVARELRSTVRVGLTCRYDPDPFRGTAWHLDADVAHGAGLRRG